MTLPTPRPPRERPALKVRSPAPVSSSSLKKPFWKGRFEWPQALPRLRPVWGWSLFGVVFVLLAVFLARPFYITPPPPADADSTPANATALPLEHYATMEECIKDGHGQAACARAFAMVQQYTVSQMPLYRTTDICQAYWGTCVGIDTGPPAQHPDEGHVIVFAPPVRGFGVFWKGDTPLVASPLYRRTDGKLVEGRDDTRTAEDLDDGS